MTYIEIIVLSMVAAAPFYLSWLGSSQRKGSHISIYGWVMFLVSWASVNSSSIQLSSRELYNEICLQREIFTTTWNGHQIGWSKERDQMTHFLSLPTSLLKLFIVIPTIQSARILVLEQTTTRHGKWRGSTDHSTPFKRYRSYGLY